MADRLLPTSDLVVARTAGAPLSRRVDPGDRVAPEPPGAVLMQRWQIAPFAAAQVQVSVANVAGRTVGGGAPRPSSSRPARIRVRRSPAE